MYSELRTDSKEIAASFLAELLGNTKMVQTSIRQSEDGVGFKIEAWAGEEPPIT